MKKTIVLTTLCFLLSITGDAQVDADNLFTCFRQGERGNCASIALIKAAINVFGIDSVFSEQRINDTLIQAVLKNGRKYSISNSDLQFAQKSADFKIQVNGHEEIINYAIKCYAVMGKVRQELEGLDTYKESLEYLERGYYTPSVYVLLGMENNVIHLKRFSNISSKCGIVAWRTKHAVFACNGFMDDHGRKESVSLRYYGRFQLVK